MLKRIFVLILFSSVLAGCSFYNVSSRDISTDLYPPKKSAEEVIYVERIDRPFDIIGYITVNAERRQKLDAVMERMKREAAILGADAITEIKTDASGRWKKLPAQNLVGNAYIRANFSATAIVFK